MFRKNYFTFLFCIALFLACGSVAFAQTYPVTGRVMMKKADNTTVPVEGALVEVFREDSKLKLPTDKTDKKGNFAFAGLQPGWKYILSVSGTGLSPNILPGVPAGADKLVITVTEGDGKRYTEDEVKNNLKNRTNSSSTNTSSNNEPTEDEKKAEAERLRIIAETAAKNTKIENANKIVTTALQDGDKAFKEKNWTLAIAKFDEGINANPEFAGSAPVLLNYKGVALKMRAFETYKKVEKAAYEIKAPEIQKAKVDFLAAMEAFDKGLAILKNAASTDAATQKGYDQTKYNIYSNYVETYRLTSQTGADRNKGTQAISVFEQYVLLEPDATLKAKAQIILGDILREADGTDAEVLGYRGKSVEAYKKALEFSPTDPDALAGLGLTLYDYGLRNNNNKEQMQEGLNYLQKYIDTAPATHPLKESVTFVVQDLKEREKLTPQKVTTTKKKP